MVTSGDSHQAAISAPMSSMRHLLHLQSESGLDASTITRRGGQPKIAHRWREIQGASDWQGLLEPVMDDALREETIRYGDLTQVCYDSFDSDPESKHYGRCKFSRAKLFQELDMADCGYQVTKYLYATSEFPFPGVMCFPSDGSLEETEKQQSNWMGYVAVCTSDEEVARLGRRDIVVCWRGTVTSTEWAADFRDVLVAVAPRLRDEDDITAADARTHLHKHHGLHRVERLLRHALEKEAVDQEEEIESHGDDDEAVKAELGFLSLYTSTLAGSRLNRLSAREQVRQEIRRLLDLYKDDAVELSITVTGHSLGGALATISAYDLARSRVNVYRVRPHHSLHAAQVGEMVAPLTAFTFGCPRVGNRAFKDHFHALGVKMLRVVNDNDIVPKVPGILGNDNIPRLALEPILDAMPWTYFHVGTELLLNNKRSPFLKPTTNPHFLHNLEIYLHLVDGYAGPGDDAGFVPHGRDLSLINKHTSSLVDDYGIPSSWWQDKNKGLRKNAKGLWAVPEAESPREEDGMQAAA